MNPFRDLLLLGLNGNIDMKDPLSTAIAYFADTISLALKGSSKDVGAVGPCIYVGCEKIAKSIDSVATSISSVADGILMTAQSIDSLSTSIDYFTKAHENLAQEVRNIPDRDNPLY